ncbi:MAG: peptidylprolyl isomerase [Myxococcota bacterium]
MARFGGFFRRRHAALHFLLLAAAAFLIEGAFLGDPREGGAVFFGDLPAPGPKRDEALLYHEALRRGLDRHDPVVRQRLIRDMRFLEPKSEASDQELYRQALDLGLDREDLVVRRRLIERVRRHLIAEARVGVPKLAELEAWLAADAPHYQIPARRSIDQIHFADRARALAAMARGQVGEGAIDALRGDPLPLPRRLPSLSRAELAGRLGPGFAGAAFAIDTDAWTGPVQSSYGHSLVRVRERTPARAPQLAEVRARVAGAWRAEREAQALEAGLSKLRARAAESSPPDR